MTPAAATFRVGALLFVAILFDELLKRRGIAPMAADMATGIPVGVYVGYLINRVRYP